MDSSHHQFSGVPASSYAGYYGGGDATVGAVTSGVSALDMSPQRPRAAGRHPTSSPSFPYSASRLPHDDAAGTMFLENVGGTTYFYTAEDAQAQGAAEPTSVPPSCLLYPGTPAHVLAGRTAGCGARPAPSVAVAGFSCSDTIREQVARRQKQLLTVPNPAALPQLPEQLDGYNQLLPLEPVDAPPVKSAVYDCVTTSYKATNMKTGQYFCLRRIHGCLRSPARCSQLAGVWRKLSHANLISVRDIFSTKGFGDDSVVIVYDYYPLLESLADRHFDQQPDVNGFADPFQDPNIPRPYSAQKTAVQRQQNSLLPEPTIWRYVVQLTAALRLVHTSGLTCRLLQPETVLLSESGRVRLAGTALPDVLAVESAPQPAQHDDLLLLGRLLLALACNSLSAMQRDNFNTALAIVERHFSSDLKALLMSLLLPPPAGRQRTINDVMPMIGARFYLQLEAGQQAVCRLEQQLSTELRCGRLFRLLAQLSTITERPQLNLDTSWAETGDRYLLKLFRDQVFHAVSSDGQPFPDLAHMMQCLDKLDVSSPDEVALVSRDSQNVLVTTYCELKLCLDRSFAEIHAASLVKDETVS